MIVLRKMFTRRQVGGSGGSASSSNSKPRPCDAVQGGHYSCSPDGEIVFSEQWQQQTDNSPGFNELGVPADLAIIVGVGLITVGAPLLGAGTDYNAVRSDR